MLSDYLSVKEEAKEFETFKASSPNTELALDQDFDF